MVEVRICDNCNLLSEAGYDKAEQAAIYEENLKEIINDPRRWLNELETKKTYRVDWKNYRYKTPTLPHTFIKKTSPI
jgi:hypothetical protein